MAVLAPRGRDSDIASKLLAGQKIDTVAASDLVELHGLLKDGVGMVLIAEEAIGDDAELGPISEFVEQQPAWSGLPFVVLANAGQQARSDADKARIDALGNALMLSRPLHADDLVRGVRSSLKARRRQYDARARMIRLEERERALHESEQKFHAISDSVDQMIWSTLPDGFHDYYNRRWYEFTGVPDGSTDGDAWTGMFHPEDQDRARRVWQHSLDTGDPYQIEYRLRHRSGHYRWVLGRAQPVRDETGQIVRWYGTCTDIDEQVKAREALANSRDLLEEAVRERTKELAELYQKTPVILHSIDGEGHLTSVSDRWLAFMGYDSREEVLGRSFADFITPESLDRHRTEYRPRFDAMDGAIDDVTYFFIKNSGETAEVLLSARTAFESDGKVARVMVSIIDVSKRRAAEAARDKAEAALRQSQKLETIGQLTGGVAHDFNNLLMAIRSSLELLRRRLPAGDDGTTKYVDNALKATDRGATLTQRMLAFARKQDLDTKAVDVAALLYGMGDLLERTIGPRVEIRLEIAPTVAEASVDANQLEMAILNLAVNARDAMNGAGKLAIHLDCLKVDDLEQLEPGFYVRIAVEDRGSGMDAATLAQAMEPFFTTKGIGKGTGLGLSMVHGLAQQSGGAFRMLSELDAGTTAEIYLPIAKQITPVSVDEAHAARDIATVEKPKRKILAVDDDMLVLLGTVGLLEDLGHTVLEAFSGEEALVIMGDHPDIDLVITDHAMPNMTGIELARTIRESGLEIPIVLASGYAEMPEGGERYIAARLEKPFSDKMLAKTIERI